MTARCTQYMSALTIVCKHKISRRLHHKNLHIIYILQTSPVCLHSASWLSPINKYVKVKLELDNPNHNPNPNPGSRSMALGLWRAKVLG